MSSYARSVRRGGGFSALALFALVCLCGAVQAGDGPRVRPIEWAQPVIGTEFGNFHCVDKDVYRSEQPDSEGMQELDRMGFRSVLNLRDTHTDDDEAKGTRLKLYLVGMEADDINDAQIRQALDILRQAPKPVLVHCWHGSDRTGVVIAMYRMVVQNWPRAKAIDELVHGGYGYHQRTFPNVVEYLNSVDPAKFR